jgi:hypothetical protein
LIHYGIDAAERTIATIPAWIASGKLAQAATTAAKSRSEINAEATTAPDSAPP